MRVWNKYEKGALNSDLRKRKSHCFFPSFAPPPTWQPDTANHSVRWPFFAIATPTTHPSWGQVPTAVSWTHGVIFFWMTSCGGTVTALHDVALIDISQLYLYIMPSLYILIVYWQFVECSKTMPFLAGTCCTYCNWRAYWLVDYNWKWPLTLCAIVPCALVMFYFLLWGSCVWMYCIFYSSISSHSHQCFFFVQQTVFSLIRKSESLQKGPFSPLDRQLFSWDGQDDPMFV